MRKPHYRYLFGPVPSRRLGRSLGVDLVPFKTCSFDCIFCQLGRTTHKTVARREYVSADAVIGELNRWLKDGGTADYITIAGSGEPTLNTTFGRVIEFARSATDIPVALLTNGSLLTDPEVRAQAALANLVKVSLSAWDQASLERLNRPAPGIAFRPSIEGLWRLRNQFQGQLWLEVFLVWGTNTTTKGVAEIARLAQAIGPDKVQLNTAVRPPCETYAYAVPERQMLDLAKLFDPPAEVIADYRAERSSPVAITEASILDMLRRRPCTLDQLCQIFALHRNEASKYLGKLSRQGQVVEQRQGGEAYFAGVPDADSIDTTCQEPTE